MPKKLTATNPFYVVLVLAGIAFCVTACAYGVMAFRDVRGGAAVIEADTGGLMGFLDRHGAALLAAEVAVLAAATVAAMWTDRFWTRRAAWDRPPACQDEAPEAGQRPIPRRDDQP